MTSPAKAHKLRVLAELSARAAPHGQEVRGSAYELMLRALAEHKRVLRGIQSVERKIEAKRELMPAYDEYLTGALAGGQGGHDMVLATLMVWHMDTGSWRRALELAGYVIANGMAMPPEYSRTPAVILIDMAATAALDGNLFGDEAVRVLAEVAQLTESHDAPDQARAKLHKAIGYALVGRTPTHTPDYKTVEETKARAAMAHFTRANTLFAQVGVKKDMERMERRLTNAAPAS
ncbi:terminase [Acidovorax sp. Root267]|uniref:phage terminase small subunit n=1 Tax=Acidovorax sp. Root267 TaxID=1736505 RepID=UPI00070C117D|nr:phage terminase small subunit [Acidovorax sp. Root267]KRD25554.1 terminase [Acidovorax sp. Root267]